MIGALAIKNRRKQLGLTGSVDQHGPPPIPSPLANRVHMCYFVAACCMVISVVIAIPAVVSDSSLFFYAGISGGVGLIFFLVTCFLSSPEPSSDCHQEVKVEPANSSKPPTLPCSPAPSSCSGRVYPKSIPRSAHSRFTRGESTDTTISSQRPGFSRDQSLDVASISNVVSHYDSSTSTPQVARETLIEMPMVNLKSSNIGDVAETSIREDEKSLKKSAANLH